MSKEKALRQGGGERSRVDGLKGSPTAAALTVNPIGEQLLAGTGLAGQQHVTLPVLRGRPGELQGLLETRVLTDDRRIGILASGERCARALLFLVHGRDSETGSIGHLGLGDMVSTAPMPHKMTKEPGIVNSDFPGED